MYAVADCRARVSCLADWRVLLQTPQLRLYPLSAEVEAGHLGAADPAKRPWLQAPRGAERTGQARDIPSRLVENLYWFGRYTVRCEDKARLLRGTLTARSDEGVWTAAVKFCRDLGVISIDGDPALSLRDDRNPQGVVADVRRLAWCASQVRTRLSASYWRAVNEMQRRLQDSVAAREEPRAALDQLLLSLAALAGLHLTT